MNRRDFIRATALATTAALGGCATTATTDEGRIMTVTGAWKTRGRIWVNRLSDGAEVGVFDPGPTVGGGEHTGWIDLLPGINAFKCSTGEYLVFVEENYKAKSLIYRWKPLTSRSFEWPSLRPGALPPVPRLPSLTPTASPPS